MFLVHWPSCGAVLAVPARAVGPDRGDPWNVIGCDECGATFDYDDEEVERRANTATDTNSTNQERR